jgi:hypothetical protein
MRALLIAVLAVAGTAGCSTFNVSEGESREIDATKRVLVTGVSPYHNRIVCAEPSPDAISSLAASLALKGELPQGPKAEVSGTFAQTVASIGLRTAAIQILRDLGYRACEGVMNGVVTAGDYDVLIAGVTRATLGLVAIEGLTQMRPAPAVVVSPGATAGTKEGAQAQTTPTTVNVTMPAETKALSAEHSKEIAAQVVAIVRLVTIDAVKETAPILKERAERRREDQERARERSKTP